MEAIGAGVPELVPARMVNEFAYCQRLFFLEWVQARWADNLDTDEGRYVHRRVDRPQGSAPLVDEGEVIRASSVTLSSLDLGMVARVDVLEGHGNNVRPVDTKRGRPPDNPERSWEPERVQLCIQGLLLREAGYQCSEGVLYFAEARERVVVPFDEALVARTRGLLGELRAVAERDIAPPPLIDSPKCPRCSLVGICLPDETNALTSRSQRPVRRLLPKDPSPRPLYVTEQGARLGKKGARVEVKRKEETLASVRLLDISQVSIFGNAQISTQLLREFFARDIPVCWFSYGGWFSGIATGLPAKNVDLRRRQVALAHQGGLEIARRMIAGKVQNCRTLLRRNSRADVTSTLASLAEVTRSIGEVTTFGSLLGLEGGAARLYFSSFPAMLKGYENHLGPQFAFAGRNRRPPTDPINALLSFVYALLVKDLTTVLHVVGFDPYLGFYHRPRFGRPALALDLAEEFRPLLADSTVVGMLNNGELSKSDFVIRAGGVAMTKNGRRTVLRAYERRLDVEVTHPVFGYKLNYRRVLDVQARLLAAHVMGEVPEYVAFTTR